MKLKLVTFSTDDCTIGKLYSSGNLLCNTIERPWLSNTVNVSCIPAGIYTIKLTDSPKFGLTYQVTNVIGRTHILFHKANKASELHGCIAPVSTFGILGNEWAGLSSKSAYDQLMVLLGTDDHKLEIERH